MANKLEGAELENKIAEASHKYEYGVLSTIEDDKPRSRYMAVFHDGLNALFLADRRSHKVDQLEDNPHASLLLGLEGRKHPGVIVDMQGTASIKKDEGIVKELWEDDMSQYWDGPEDPNIVVLELKPETIVYTEGHNEQSVWKRS